VRRLLVDLVLLAIVATVVLAVVLAAGGSNPRRAVDIYLVALGGLALIALVRATREAAPPTRFSEFDAALRRHSSRDEPVATLERTTRDTALGVSRAVDLHVRLRPILREIATQRLTAHRGIDLDTQPDAVRAVLGDEAFELLRADRVAPPDRLAPGIGPAALDRLLDDLERI
jgi:hypothetical protein